MDDLLARIAAKKAELDRLKRDPRRSVANFDHSQDLELTYTSNAIEGNTLTAVETTMVIEQGITIAGKPLGWMPPWMRCCRRMVRRGRMIE